MNQIRPENQALRGARWLFRSQGRAFAPLVIASFLAIIILTLPAPAPDNSADASLGGVLHYAARHDLHFARDILFTYGPLGHLMFFYYSPHLADLRMVVDLGLCFLVAAGFCLAAWRTGKVHRWVLLGVFIWLTPNLQSRADFIINVGLCSWGLLCFVESGRPLRVAVAALLVLSVFGALAKLSFLVSASVLIVVLSIELGLRFKWWLALALPLAYFGMFVFGWVALGQEVGLLLPFFHHSVSLIGAYQQALGFEGLEPVTLAGLLLAILLLGSIILQLRSTTPPEQKWLRVRKWLLLVWLGFLVTTVWKHSFTRQDHAYYFLAFAPLLMMLLAVIGRLRGSARLATHLLSATGCLVALVGLSWAHFPAFRVAALQPFRSFAGHAQAILNPAGYQAEMDLSFRRNESAANLPAVRSAVRDASVDVFGQSQAYALANHLNYRPRPVFQSYVACSADLMRLNQEYYHSPSRPDYVLFSLEPMDRRLPPVEDALVLREILMNYEPVLVEQRFLLLKTNRQERAALTLLKEGVIKAAERIDLAPYKNQAVWLEVSMQPSAAGYLRRLLFRPPVVRLAMWGANDGRLLVRNRAPPSMLAAGFLASPLLQRNQDVIDLFSGKETLQPGACSVELLPGEEEFWHPRFSFRIWRIDTARNQPVFQEATCRTEALLGAPRLTPQPDRESTAPDASELKLFRPTRWRSGRPPPGSAGEQLVLILFVGMTLGSASLLRWVVVRARAGRLRLDWKWLITGNLGLFCLLCSGTLTLGELYFRFFYDSTDALAFTKVSERWVMRHWELNLSGCRDNIEYHAAIAPGKRRVTFVGDSFTAGHGIRNVEDRFGNLFRRTHPGWETHVLANVGLDTGGELELLRKAVGLGYQLDEVILVYCLNDIGDLVPAEGMAFQGELESVDQAGWLARNSYCINLFYHRARIRQHPYLKDYGGYTLKAYNGAVWEKQKQRFRELRDLVEANGGHLTVMTFPFLHSIGPDYPFRTVHAQLEKAWRELGVPQVDLMPAFSHYRPQDLMVNAHDAHPNEKANLLAAEVLNNLRQWR